MENKFTKEKILEMYGKSKILDYRGFIFKDGTISEMGRYDIGEFVHNDFFYDKELRNGENLICYNYRCGDLNLRMLPQLTKKQFNVIMKNVFHDFAHRRIFIDIVNPIFSSFTLKNIKHEFSMNEKDKKEFEMLLKEICEIIEE